MMVLMLVVVSWLKVVVVVKRIVVIMVMVGEGCNEVVDDVGDGIILVVGNNSI